MIHTANAVAQIRSLHSKNMIGSSCYSNDLNVYFWNSNNLQKPTHVFKGKNTDVVKGIDKCCSCLI